MPLHGFACELLIGAPGHRWQTQEELQEAQVKEWRPRFQRHPDPAGILTFQHSGPVGAVQRGIGLRVDGMFINRRISPLPPSVFEVRTALEILGNPVRITLPIILAKQQSPEACPKTTPKRRNLTVSPEITAKGLGDSGPVTAFLQIEEIGPCPSGQNIVAAITRKHNAGMGGDSLEESRGSCKKHVGGGLGSCF